MFMAAIGDISGNLPALQAALHAIDDAGIHTVVNVGDSVAGQPDGNGVMNALRERAITSVQGMRDRFVVRYQRKRDAVHKRLSADDAAAVERAHEALSSENLEYLRGLRKHERLVIEGLSIYVCHGSPSSQTDFIQEDTAQNRLQRHREVTNADIVICGGRHSGFVRFDARTLFVHPGSLVAPGAPGIAHYAVVNTETDPWSVEFCEAPYEET